MKNLTTEDQIKKLEAKASKIADKINRLKTDQTNEERVKAFDLIMELGQKHKLFNDLERELQAFNGKEKIKITMINPARSGPQDRLKLKLC
jgi:hypothetical protein